jgi:hypothetical protein
MEDKNTSNSIMSPNPITYSYEGRNVAGAVGFALGVAYAFKTKSGFWKGWGYGIIGGLVLGGIGYGIGMMIKKKPSATNNTANDKPMSKQEIETLCEKAYEDALVKYRTADNLFPSQASDELNACRSNPILYRQKNS